MQGFTTIDLIILIVYLAAVLVIGLAFAKKDMQGKEFFRGGRNDSMVGDLCLDFRHTVESDLFSVTGGKFLCRHMDSVVCAAWYADCHSSHHPVFPAHVQPPEY